MTLKRLCLWWLLRFIEGLNNGVWAFGGQTTRDGVRIVSRDVTADFSMQTLEGRFLQRATFGKGQPAPITSFPRQYLRHRTSLLYLFIILTLC